MTSKVNMKNYSGDQVKLAFHVCSKKNYNFCILFNYFIITKSLLCSDSVSAGGQLVKCKSQVSIAGWILFLFLYLIDLWDEAAREYSVRLWWTCRLAAQCHSTALLCTCSLVWWWQTAFSGSGYFSTPIEHGPWEYIVALSGIQCNTKHSAFTV